jgi:hypothetical protein
LGLILENDHTLSPPPINFTQIDLEVDGKLLEVKWDGYRLSLEQAPEPITKRDAEYLMIAGVILLTIVFWVCVAIKIFNYFVDK